MPLRRFCETTGFDPETHLFGFFSILLGRGKFARFDDDFGEPIGESVEATARSAVGQCAAEHLQHMLSSE